MAMPKNKEQIVMLENAISRLEALLQMLSGKQTPIIDSVETNQLLQYLQEFFPTAYDVCFPGKSVGTIIGDCNPELIGIFLKSCRAVMISIWRKSNNAAI